MTLFLFGTAWFWILMIVSAVLITSSTESEDLNFTSNLWFIVTLGLLYWFGNDEFFKGMLSFIVDNPWKTMGILIGYVLIGTAWSLLKWFFYLKAIHNKFELNSDSYFSIDRYKASSNKDRIVHWMLYWPLSASWTMINDPFKKIFNAIVTQFSGIYDKMSSSILKDIIAKKQK